MKHVKKESIVIAWMKKNPSVRLSVCLSVCMSGYTYVDTITLEGVSGSKQNLVVVFYVRNVCLVLKSRVLILILILNRIIFTKILQSDTKFRECLQYINHKFFKWISWWNPDSGFNSANLNLALKVGNIFNSFFIRYSALLEISPILIFVLWYINFLNYYFLFKWLVSSVVLNWKVY